MEPREEQSMRDIEVIQKKQDRIRIIVCINFVLFMVLFIGMGYVTWQSAALVNQLKGNLDEAEQTVAQLKDRFQQIDTDEVVERLVASASSQISDSLRHVVQNSDIAAPITQISEKLNTTQETFEKINEAITGINETVKGLDNEEISKLISYYILKDLGDGLHKAAEHNKPESIVNSSSKD
jgi:predicted PurR-regulated permease PerM